MKAEDNTKLRNVNRGNARRFYQHTSIYLIAPRLVSRRVILTLRSASLC
jgi:hypothetical protein